MTNRSCTWGTVSTIKAPLPDILGFAAWHLEQGAHRLYIYLDEPDPEASAILKAHPKIRCTTTTQDYWDKKGRRPGKHQPRQTANAADAYGKMIDVDWLLHIDVDEFLTPRLMAPSLSAQLSVLPQDCLCARIRPLEALGWDGPEDVQRPFKSLALDRDERRDTTRALYPRFGEHLNGGFLSHVAGKLAYRTGLPDFYAKIHNVFQGDVTNPGQLELDEMHLLHMHGQDWDRWYNHFRYRHQKGAYRAELKARIGGLTMHELLIEVDAAGGQAALRSFWDEVCLARPDLLDGLNDAGLLHWHALNLTPLITKHFPGAPTL